MTGEMRSLDHLTAVERIERFAAGWERHHPRQPLQDSIYGLDAGADHETELRLSDLKELLRLVKGPVVLAGPLTDEELCPTRHLVGVPCPLCDKGRS
jgi:hypothetical protein